MGLELRAVADLEIKTALARAAEFKAQSVHDLLGNPDPDVVINLTIPDPHYGVTKRILEAGKHAVWRTWSPPCRPRATRARGGSRTPFSALWRRI